MQLMVEGDKWEMYILCTSRRTWRRNYGDRAMGNIPPGSTLVFEMEIIKIQQPAEKSELMKFLPYGVAMAGAIALTQVPGFN